MAVELFTNQATTTVTSGGTTAPASGTSESWTVASSSTFPAASTAAGSQFRVVEDDATRQSEIVLVTNVSGTTWTVTRGAEGTTPVAHPSGFNVVQTISAGVLGNLWQAPAKTVRAYRSGTVQSIPNGTNTAVQLNGEDFDTLGAHDSVTNNTRLTIPAGESGYYLISGVLSMFGTTGQYREVTVRVNGSTDIVTTNMPPATYGRYPFATVSNLNAGWYIEVYANQDSGAALDLQPSAVSSFVTMTKVGT